MKSNQSSLFFIFTAVDRCMQRFLDIFKCSLPFLAMALLAIGSPVAFAEAPDLTASGGAGGFFAPLVALMQAWANFIGGPFAILFIFLGIALTVVVWIVAPNAGQVMGIGIRIIVGGWILFNAGALAVYLNA